MKKLIFLFILSLLMVGMAWGQTTINFDDPAKWTEGSGSLTSYSSDHAYADGVFSATGRPALRSTTSDQDGYPEALGTYSWRMRNFSTIDWRITIASGGVSTFSMAIRRWDASPSPAFNIEYSTDGGTTWVLVSTVNNTTLDNVSAWKTFEGTINSSNENILIRLVATDTTERIMIDDFTWTGFAGGDPVTEIPAFNPVAGTYYSTQYVTISSATAGASIYYTLNGDTPSDQSTPYSSPIEISQNTTVKAIAYATGYQPSSVATAIYAIESPQYASIPYSQSFDTDLGDTYNYSVSGATKEWYYYATDQAAVINGYNSGDIEEDWLILPGLNMNVNSYETMSFDTWRNYGILGDNDYLKLYYSANYAGIGDPTSATWTEIPFTQPEDSSTWTPSGLLDLSGISGTSVFFAFKYSATPGNYTQWKVDSISIIDLPPNMPILTVNPSGLTDFSYLTGEGPSAAQSFTVTGSNLTANISVLAPTNYEISTSETTGFTNSLTLTQVGGEVAETPLYVRLTASLPVGTYTGVSITVNSTGATEATVALSGSVTSPDPIATILMRPAQISLADATHESAVLVQVQNYASDSVKYRLYNVNQQYYPWDAATETWITSASYSAGPLVPGTPSTSSSWWIPFQRGSNNSVNASYRDRLDPYSSNHQTAVLPEATAITNGVVIDDSQVSFNTWNDYTAKHIALAFDATDALISAASTNINDGAFNIWVESGTTITRIEIRDVMNNLIESVTGTWPSGQIPASLSVNPATLSGFTYEEDSGPSAEQSFVVSGSNLDANVSITAPANFEISQISGSGFDSILTLNHTGGTLAETTVYVRLKAGLEVGSYTDEIIDISSGTATAKTVTVSGSVTGPIPPAANLFFSEYIEGSSNNKALEIFNASDATVDLSLYKVELHSSAAVEPGNTLTLSGTLASGEVYVIAHASADPAILAEADVTSTVTYFNGDDALVLRYISTDTIIDQIGTIDGVDPGTGWEVAGVANATAEHTLIRKPSVETGSTNWVSQQGTDADDSEWVVLAQNYSENLGTHTFGSQVAASPIFNPPAGTYMAAIDVSISSETANATIYYTTDGSTPSDTNGSVYASLIEVSETTTIKAIAYADGFEPSLVSEATYNIPISVSNIAELRTMPTGASNAYILTGEAIITFQQSSRNQKYIQDATGAILIDDPAAVITTTYNLYDGITGIAGTLAPYNELLQFTPVADPGQATSSNNVVIPEVRTLASLTSADQGKLIKVMNLTFNQIGDFSSYAQNIEVQDASGTLTLRTFSGADYAGTPIPAEPVNLVCLVGQFNTSMQIGHRFLSDIETISGQLDTPIVEISYDGDFLYLNWPAVDGANSYRVESANEPYAETFNTVGTTGDNTMVLMPTTPKKFYRVIALP